MVMLNDSDITSNNSNMMRWRLVPSHLVKARDVVVGQHPASMSIPKFDSKLVTLTRPLPTSEKRGHCCMLTFAFRMYCQQMTRSGGLVLQNGKSSLPAVQLCY